MFLPYRYILFMTTFCGRIQNLAGVGAERGPGGGATSSGGTSSPGQIELGLGDESLQRAGGNPLRLPPSRADAGSFGCSGSAPHAHSANLANLCMTAVLTGHTGQLGGTGLALDLEVLAVVNVSPARDAQHVKLNLVDDEVILGLVLLDQGELDALVGANLVNLVEDSLALAQVPLFPHLNVILTPVIRQQRTQLGLAASTVNIGTDINKDVIVGSVGPHRHVDLLHALVLVGGGVAKLVHGRVGGSSVGLFAKVVASTLKPFRLRLFVLGHSLSVHEQGCNLQSVFALLGDSDVQTSLDGKLLAPALSKLVLLPRLEVVLAEVVTEGGGEDGGHAARLLLLLLVHVVADLNFDVVVGAVAPHLELQLGHLHLIADVLIASKKASAALFEDGSASPGSVRQFVLGQSHGKERQDQPIHPVFAVQESTGD